MTEGNGMACFWSWRLVFFEPASSDGGTRSNTDDVVHAKKEKREKKEIFFLNHTKDIKRMTDMGKRQWKVYR